MFKICLLCFVSGLFLCTCGLEEVIIVNEPTVTNNNPLYSSTDYTTYYCDFYTNENKDNSSFLGTEIYYKIYNNTNTLCSERDNINNVNYSTNGSSSATKMIETYTYQPLGTYPQSSHSIFIPKNQSYEQQRVYFRLIDNGQGDELKADIRVANVSQGKIPYRYMNDLSFDFFDNDDSDSADKVDVEPVEGDSDYKHSSSATSSDSYYVQFFAVGVAWNPTTCSRSYSLVLDLGSIPVTRE